MIRHLSIQGLGPCASLSVDLSPEGTTTITGPSEVGKSTLIRAATWALLGVDIDGSPLDVRTLHDVPEHLTNRAEVVLVTKSGTVITRTLTRSRSSTRKIERAGNVAEYGSEEQFGRALGTVAKTLPIGTSTEAVARFILAPFAWEALCVKGGKALRELLGHLVPGDVRLEVGKLMGGELAASDPIDEKTAVEARRIANAERDAAVGALKEANAAVEGLTEPSTATDTTEAFAIIDAGKAWTDFEATATKHAADVAARETNAATRAKARADREAAHQAEHDRAAIARDQWDSRNLALGTAPKHPIEPARTKDREALEALQTRIVTLSTPTNLHHPKLAENQRDLEAARRTLAELEAAGEVCPTCHREGWRDAQQALDKASVTVTALQEAGAIADAEANAASEAAESKRVAELATAEAEREKLRKKIAAYDTAKAQFDADLAAWKAYDQARVALGEKPALPRPPVDTEQQYVDAQEWAGDPLVEPVMPQSKRPTAIELATAQWNIDAATQAAGARAEYERTKSTASMRVTTTRIEAERLSARAAYLDRLVTAVRQAPIERASRQKEVLGDLGPVSFVVTAGGAEVLFDGRPAFLASRGRRVVCDLWLRAGLRRALGMTWAPCFVDDAASWTGDWPAIPGPLVFLVTAETESGELVVESNGKEAAVVAAEVTA